MLFCYKAVYCLAFAAANLRYGFEANNSKKRVNDNL